MATTSQRHTIRHGGSSYSPNSSELSLLKSILHFFIPFILGCFICTTIILHHQIHKTPHITLDNFGDIRTQFKNKPIPSTTTTAPKKTPPKSQSSTTPSTNIKSLSGLNILIAIASYDFSQIPHLEEVLDSYRDLCESGSNVTIVIHTTIAYPVALIDLLNTRLQCVNPSGGFRITISVHSPRLELHLVDLHRQLFYDRIDEFDLFIYTEDDIRVRPTTIAAYLDETQRVETLLSSNSSTVQPADVNVGIVRYEYDYPSSIIIDDKTRFATTNVSRVYWEHLRSGNKPIIPTLAEPVGIPPLSNEYLSMTNHHQGMFIATRSRLLSWKERKNCQFHIASNRPGLKDNPSQHLMGTQRVWMSSAMMYSKTYCSVTQLIPAKRFGSLTVHHLPNKNYRRVGKKGRLGGTDKDEGVLFADGSEVFQARHELLLSEMEFHFAMRREMGGGLETRGGEYEGIDMVDEFEYGKFHTKKHKNAEVVLKRRMAAFKEYVKRGGGLVEEDIEEFKVYGLGQH